MFKKILIANRGEIACRVIRTARSMGIHSVAIYSSVDQDSLHVREADSAYWIGEAAAKDSYLNIAQIIKVARECGAEAIHPGYGFLSENPKFAQACADAEIVFIGPSITAINAMASKQLAKQLLEKTTVPLTPGYHGSEQSEQQLLAEAKKIGFPVLIKAANGGGGKGMRAVVNEAEFGEALAGAKRESQSSFGDETMIIEKLVTNPRHVELQIMADNHGNVVHLFERDCSIQRRHQKIIEEAPAPNLSASLRQRLAAAACEVARSIKYTGAGTVEFLVDGEDHFYFMEMNTRLQVEHPVTEMITGLDLVAWQLKIAANEVLPLTQEQIEIHGHAIECRVYAEDPFNGFIPSIGTIHFLNEPSGQGIRIDTGVTLNSQITMYYDPMVAKLIACGQNREEALQRLQHALSSYFIGGVKTNIPFLQAICSNPSFYKARLSTNFLEKESLELTTPNQELALQMAAAWDYLTLITHIKDPLLKEAFAYRPLGRGCWKWTYLIQNTPIETIITPVDDHSFCLKMNNIEYSIRARSTKQNQVEIEVDNQQHQAIFAAHNQQLTLYFAQGQITIDRFQWRAVSSAAATNKGQLTAPMPSTVVAILKKVGEKVKAGDSLIVLEAMKMEHTIHAPTDGVLLDIFYSVGAQVNDGAELLALSAPES